MVVLALLSLPANQPARALSAMQQFDDDTPAPVSVTLSLRRPLVVLSHRVPVSIELDASLSSRNAAPGDTFSFILEESIVCHGAVVVRKGARGMGSVKKARRARNFGRSGKISLHLGAVPAVDGTPVRLGLPARDEWLDEKESIAAASSLVGLAALGPLGLAGGILVQGDDVVLKAGTKLRVYPVCPVLVRAVWK